MIPHTVCMLCACTLYKPARTFRTNRMRPIYARKPLCMKVTTKKNQTQNNKHSAYPIPFFLLCGCERQIELVAPEKN